MGSSAGDFIELEYTGRIQSTGEVFTTTDAEIAKKSNIYDKRTQYGSVTVVIGKPFMLPGFDKQLPDVEIGKTTKLVGKSDEAYGPRKTESIETVSVKRIRKSGVKPVVGARVQSKQRYGRIVSINAGKARVDYNHFLAGKNLEFEVTVKEIIEDQDKKITAIVRKYVPNTKLEDIKFEINPEDKEDISIELNPILLLTQGSGEVMIRMLGDFRDSLGFQKIELKFPFDFSKVKDTEKELESLSTEITSSEEEVTED